MAGQPDFFDVDKQYSALSAAGNPMKRLAGVVDFEILCPVLDATLARLDCSRYGRPPYDAVLMFRVLVLQAFKSPSDEQANSSCATSCPSYASRASGYTKRCRMPRRSGSTTSSPSRRAPSTGCSIALTRG